MNSMEKIVERQREKLGDAYRLLHEVMPEFFFRTIGDRLGDVLPLLCNLDPSSGIRRAEINAETLLVYFRSPEANPTVTSRRMAVGHLNSAAVHQAVKPLLFDGKPYTLVVEHYIAGTPARSEAHISLEELQAAYRRLFGAGREEELREIHGRINFAAVADLDAERLAQRIRAALDAQNSDTVRAELENWEDDTVRLTVSLAQPVPQPDLFHQLIEAVDLAGFEPRRAYFRELTFHDHDEDFHHQPVMVTTLYLATRTGGKPDAAALARLLEYVRLINYVEMDDLLHRELVRRHHFHIEDANFIRAVGEFVHGQLAFVDRNAYNYDDIFRFLALYPALSARLAAAFRRRFAPGNTSDEPLHLQEFEAETARINSGDPDKDHLVRNVFRAAADFLAHIRKTNFFAPEKSALSFRLDPGFMQFYLQLGNGYAEAFPPERPHGVFFFHRRGAIGYQIRFSEIARGGWRTVIPMRSANELEAFDNYAAAKDELFREVYVLAHTQHLKNKDIYEGGSKMITLLDPVESRTGIKPMLWQAQRCIFQAFLTLINYDENGRLRDQTVTDRLGRREIIEIGPDENMFDPMILWMGEYAAEQGYTLGSGIISGKPGAGINHKEYGVTSFGVHQYLLKTLEELGIDPTRDEFSIKISGGPAGDVAGNELKLLLAGDDAGRPLYPGLRLVAITDGPAVAFDPEGLDREELQRLLFRGALDEFNPKKLRGEGASILYAAPVVRDDEERHELVVRRDGKLEKTTVSRDDFMRLFQQNLTHYADVFIPAGGRPSTIDVPNVPDYFPGNRPSFRAIVEGANSFITPAAREEIQKRGVLIIKDASANKCGVITSSYEILAGLMLSEEEFKEVKPELVREVKEILRSRARREADWLYAHFHSEGMPLTRLTDRLSREINNANDRIFAYLGQHPEMVTDRLLESHLPPLFSDRFADRPARLPAEYRRAIASVELACRMVYALEGGDLGRQLFMLLNDREKEACQPNREE